MNHFLVADIGGTNARLGLVTAEGNEVFGIEQFSNRDFPSLFEIVQAFLRKAQCAVSPRRACFAVASPVTGDRIQFTNNSWSFSIEELKNQLGLDSLHVINDFEAVARSLPYLGGKELRKVGGGFGKPHQALAVMGPGTGLGMAGLIPALPKALPLPTEGGHARFAPKNEVEQIIARHIEARLGFVQNEDLLSGQGLVNIHGALMHHHQKPTGALDAATISQRALDKSDAVCLQALQVFCSILGAVAGDYALQLGATGGLYIAGGIVPRFIDFFETSEFRASFEAKGRFTAYVSAIPTYVILGTQPGLIGAASFFDEAY